MCLRRGVEAGLKILCAFPAPNLYITIYPAEERDAPIHYPVIDYLK